MPPKKAKVLERFYLSAAASPSAPEEASEDVTVGKKKKRKPRVEIKDIDLDTINLDNKTNVHIEGYEKDFPELDANISKFIPLNDTHKLESNNTNDHNEGDNLDINGDEDLSKFGIYYCDDYDYGQYLRPLNSFHFQAEDFQVKKSKKNKKTHLPPLQEKKILETKTLDEAEEEQYDLMYSGELLEVDEAGEDNSTDLDDFFLELNPLLQEMICNDDAADDEDSGQLLEVDEAGEDNSTDVDDNLLELNPLLQEIICNDDASNDAADDEDQLLCNDDASDRSENHSGEENILISSEIIEQDDSSDVSKLFDLQTDFPTLSKANKTKLSKKKLRSLSRRHVSSAVDPNLAETNNEEEPEETDDEVETNEEHTEVTNNEGRTEEETNAFFDNIVGADSGSDEERDEVADLNDEFYNMKMNRLSKADQQLLDNENADFTEKEREHLMHLATSTQRSKNDRFSCVEWTREFEGVAAEKGRARTLEYCKQRFDREESSSSGDLTSDDESEPEDITTRPVSRLHQPRIIRFSDIFGQKKKKGLTAKDMKSHDAQYDHTERRDEELATNKSIISMLSVRPLNESTDDRRARKNAYKLYRRARREEKQANKAQMKQAYGVMRAARAGQHKGACISIL